VINLNEEKNISEIYSILGLIFSIISFLFLGTFVFSILGFIFSFFAKKKDESNHKAQVGLILSILSFILSIILIIVAIILLIGLFWMKNK